MAWHWMKVSERMSDYSKVDRSEKVLQNQNIVEWTQVLFLKCPNVQMSQDKNSTLSATSHKRML